MYEMCFRDRGTDGLCMKRVSKIGVLIGCVETRFRDRRVDLGFSFVGSLFSPLCPLYPSDIVGFLYKSTRSGLIPLSPSLPLSTRSLVITMSSPSSSYVQVGLDNLERPLNRSPSPHAQVRGFDWSSVLVD